MFYVIGNFFGVFVCILEDVVVYWFVDCIVGVLCDE